VAAHVGAHHRALEQRHQRRDQRPDVKQPAKGGFFHVSRRRRRIAGFTPLERLQDHAVGVREEPELDVTQLARQLEEALAHLAPGPLLDPLGEMEGRDDLALDLGRDTEHPEREPLRLEQVGIGRRIAPPCRTIRSDDAEPPRESGQAAQLAPRAVRARRHCACKRLRVDVALVGERKPFGPQRLG
jgi:hypothetical protein